MTNTLFFHGKTIDNKRFTIAGQVIESGSRSHKRKELLLGLAMCSKSDPFVKKVGRAKAEGRIKSNSSYGKLTVPIDSSVSEIKAFISIANSFTAFKSRAVKKAFEL